MVPPTSRYPEAGSPRLQPGVSSGLTPSQNEEGVLTPDLPHLDDGSRLVAELASASHTAPRPHLGTPAPLPAARPSSSPTAIPPPASWPPTPTPGASSPSPPASKPPPPKQKTLRADATALPADLGLFDLILCDVPCSGTGTLSRNPEIRQRLQPADLDRQATRQREILTAALARLAPGGHLLYSTCSLEPEENEQVVAAALAASPGISALSLEPHPSTHLAATGMFATPPPPNLLRDGQLRTLPGANFSGDGFFAALLHRP